MILVHQRYFAKPGLRGRALETRREASGRLAELGVPAGRIWVSAGGGPAAPDGVPDVVWECTYPDLDERVRDFQERDPAFAAIRVRQGTQLARWAREHYRLLE